MKKKVFIIAEADVNHNGKMDLAYRMIDVALTFGADAIKFQVYVPEMLVTSDLGLSPYQRKNMGRKGSQLEMLKKYELNEESFGKLVQYAKKKKIMLLATPFDFKSVDLLVKFKRPYLKIDSGSVVNYPFLEYAAKTQIPLILSTGGSTLKEVREAVGVIEQQHNQLMLLHCTSMYPTPFKRVNLLAMMDMMKVFKYPIGYSDHTVGNEVAVAATALGAKIIEKHFTLDRRLIGPDHKASAEPREFKQMVQAIRNIEEALGSFAKAPSQEEKKVMELGRRSLIASMDLKRGLQLGKEHIVIKRLGTGIQPKHFLEILGCQLRRNVAKDTPLKYSDIERSTNHG